MVLKLRLNSALSNKHKRTEIFSLLTELRGRQLRDFMEVELYSVLWDKVACVLFLHAVMLIVMVPKGGLTITFRVQVSR